MLVRWSSEGELGPRRGGLHPLERLRLEKEGALVGRTGAIPTPRELFVLDEIVLAAPYKTRLFLVAWYRRPDPVTVKAKRLGIARSTIYVHWRRALEYVLGEMRRRGVGILA